MSARILVEGVGSVGGLLAGELLSHGHDLTLLTGHAKITAAIQRDGIAIDTPERKFTVAAKAYTTLAELPAGSRFDSAWLLMMAGAVQDAARDTRPLLAEHGTLVSFQNGMVGERIAALCGAERLGPWSELSRQHRGGPSVVAARRDSPAIARLLPTIATQRQPQRGSRM